MSYFADVLADVPQHYWRLADGVSVILHDLSVTPLHLVIPTISTNGGYSGVEPLSGSTYAGAGVGQCLNAVTLVQPLTFEICVWVFETRAIECALIGDGGSGTNKYGIYLETTDKVIFRANGTAIQSPAAISRQAWHHICGTYDGVTGRLYVDGTQVATAAVGGLTTEQATLWVGLNSSAAAQPHAFLAEAAIYASVLSAARVAVHAANVTSTSAPTGGIAGGALQSTSGAVALQGAQLDDILGSVRKTY